MPPSVLSALCDDEDPDAGIGSILFFLRKWSHKFPPPHTNAAHDLGQFGARFGTPLTYQLSKLAHCMQKPGDILRAFIFMLRAWDMAAPSTSDACAMTASGRGRTGTDDTQAESRVFCSHATYARARLIFDAPS